MIRKTYRKIEGFFGFRIALLHWGSSEQIWKRILKCPVGLHSPYPSYYYPTCWVCGKGIYKKQHEDWLKTFKKHG